MKNFVKEKLRRGEPAVGTGVGSSNPDYAELLAGLGFDWISMDLEHGLITVEGIQRCIQAMNGYRSIPFVRVPSIDPVYFKWVLDMGAYGMTVPMVSSAEDARRAVQYSKYPPLGMRGWGPRRASRFYQEAEEYTKTANEETMTVAMIETKDGVDNIDKILVVPGIDAVLAGPYDLAMSLGLQGRSEHPTVQRALQKILLACKKHKIAAGIGCTEKNINKYMEQGFLFCNMHDDDAFVLLGAKACLKIVKGWKPG